MPLEELVASVLDVPLPVLNDATSQATLANWNSLGHINLITALEEIYQVTFSTDEIQSATSLAALRQALRSKGVAV